MEEQEKKEPEQDTGYVPRPAKEVWLARLGVVLFGAFIVYQIVCIARGGL